jgi:hypothetical protein
MFPWNFGSPSSIQHLTGNWGVTLVVLQQREGRGRNNPGQEWNGGGGIPQTLPSIKELNR